jgi:hypothetical protein
MAKKSDNKFFLNNFSPTSFSARKLLVFGAIFAPIAVYLLVRGFAAPNDLPGDVNGDNTVNTTDMSIVLSNFGKTPAQSSDPNADINFDGIVGISDLSIILSNWGKTVTSTGAPAAPSGVKATAGNGQVTITWNANTEPNISYYAVRRSTSSTADMSTWTRLAPNYTTPTATDTGLTNGTTYYYYVTAVDSTNQVSTRSNVVSATPTSGTTPPPTTPPPTTPPPSSGGNPTPTGVKIFDGTRLSSWPTVIEASSDRITEVPDPLGGGKTVLRFHVDDSDTVISPNPRAQLESPNFVNPGDEIWWGGRILFPSNFPTPSNSGWISVDSVYGPPYAGASPAPIQVVKCACDSAPSWGLVNTNWTTRYWGFPLSSIRGKWMTWLVHEKFAASGWMEVWVNGQNVMPRRNITLIDSANNGGTNHVSQTFYRQKGMFSGFVDMYHADFGVWKVN